jgi:hypothetical protein
VAQGQQVVVAVFGEARHAGAAAVAAADHVGDRSRAPRRHPNRTPEHIESALLALRDRYGWGAGKLLQVLGREHPSWKLPSRFTANRILDRHGKLRKNRRRRRWKHPGALRLETAGPNGQVL